MQEDTEKTIEAVLFDALLKTRLIESRATSNYHRCGRTDKGVSAFSQVKKTMTARCSYQLSLSYTSYFLFFFRTHDPCGTLRPVVRLHCCLSFSSRTASGSEHPHQSVMLSNHLLGGLPRG